MTPDLSRKVLDVHCTVYCAVERSKEIEAYLWEILPLLPEFVILDDNAEANYEGKLVQTVFEHGLTEENAMSAIAILGH